MASVHKQPGKPHWFVAFYDPEGFRRFRSTGTENRRAALAIASTVEQASILTRRGRLSNERALKLIRTTAASIGETCGKLEGDRAQRMLEKTFQEFIRIAGGDLATYTVRQWFDSWLAGRTDAAPRTVETYKAITGDFMGFLGARADRALTTLQTKDVEDYKSHLLPRVAPTTVNRALKVIKAALNAAVARRQLEFNPAAHVPGVEESEGVRRPFTQQELQAILAATLRPEFSEWRTMVLVGYYTGLRLRDCANLTWREVELHTGTIGITTQKTGRRQVLPIAEPLAKHLGTLAGDNPDAPLCPTLYGKPASTLSNLFYEVMTSAGIARPRDHRGKGKGRDAKRNPSQISFHSLRFNTTSGLKSGGVSDAVARDIVGHETASVSRHYTKIDDAAKRAAIARLPDITQ